MKVLSLFDGMSCGMIALERAGIDVDGYYAAEIDKYAIKVSGANYPGIKRLGDVQTINYQMLPKIDLLIGGSPCQGFSLAGKGLNFSDPRSALFFEFVHAIKETKPKQFLLENVNMRQEIQDAISKLLGCEPVKINSNLVSAQNRNRLYWTNIKDVGQPEDKKIVLSDILEHGITDRLKSHCIDANYFKGGNLKSYFEKHRRQLIFQRGRGNNKGGYKALNGKTPTLSSSSWEHNNFLVDKTGVRKLTPIECERLQTVPEGYTNHVSDSQRYKMLGNGWTVDVISHIFKGIA